MYGRTAQGTPFRLPRNDPILQAPCGMLVLARQPAGGFFASRDTPDAREDGPHAACNPRETGSTPVGVWGISWGCQVGAGVLLTPAPGSIPGSSTSILAGTSTSPLR